jgi:hypothetical protein
LLLSPISVGPEVGLPSAVATATEAREDQPLALSEHGIPALCFYVMLGEFASGLTAETGFHPPNKKGG